MSKVPKNFVQESYPFCKTSFFQGTVTTTPQELIPAPLITGTFLALLSLSVVVGNYSGSTDALTVRWNFFGNTKNILHMMGRTLSGAQISLEMDDMPYLSHLTGARGEVVFEDVAGIPVCINARYLVVTP